MGDLVPDEFLVTLSEAVDGAFKRCGSELEASSGLFVIQDRTLDGDVFLEDFVEVLFLGGPVFGAEVRRGLIEHGESPTAVEDLFGIGFGRRFALITFFGLEFIEGNDGLAAAAFLGVGARPFVSEEVFHDSEKPGTKAALSGISSVEKAPCEELSKEFLGEFFGCIGIITAAADVSVKRIPIGAAEIFEGVIRLGRK